MENELTIQQVAALTGLTEHTLRYYERAGLLDPVGRAASGHRRYTTRDIEWITFLTRLRATGMLIRQMQQYAELARRGPATAQERRLLLEAHRQAVLEHLREQEQHLALIEHKIRIYAEIEATHNGVAEGVAETATVPVGADNVPADTA